MSIQRGRSHGEESERERCIIQIHMHHCRHYDDTLDCWMDTKGGFESHARLDTPSSQEVKIRKKPKGGGKEGKGRGILSLPASSPPHPV